MKTLKEVKVGEDAVVKRLHGEGATKRRIIHGNYERHGGACKKSCTFRRSH